MISLTKKRDQQGFTIVELLIVIVVIGILAALVVTTYAGIQGKARDSKRKTDLQAMQTQIEAYYAEENHYPSYTNLNSDQWRSTEANHLKSLKADTLTDPSGTAATLKAGEAGATDKKYGYQPVNDAGTSCESDATTCTGYTLSAYLEGSKTVYTKTALD